MYSDIAKKIDGLSSDVVIANKSHPCITQQFSNILQEYSYVWK